MVSMKELPLDQSEKSCLGYWPREFEKNNGGSSDENQIAGGDVRLFQIKVAEIGVRVLKKVRPLKRPAGRFLALHDVSNVKEEILRHPTFFQHFDGVKLDWIFLRDRDRKRVTADSGWLLRQKLRIVIDFTPGCNLFPDLTLSDFYKPDYKATVDMMDAVFAKMRILGASDAVLSLTRIGEQVQRKHSENEINSRYRNCVINICASAKKHGVTLHFQAHPRRSISHVVDKTTLCKPAYAKKTLNERLLAFLKDIGADNVRLALNTGHTSMSGELLAAVIKKAGKRLGMVLVCSTTTDVYGQMYDTHAPVAGSKLKLKAVAACGTPLIFDAAYQSWNEVYCDLKAPEWRLRVSSFYLSIEGE